MVGAVDDVFVVDGFDNVYFAADRPAYVIDVFAKHPEGRPDSFAKGKCDAGFDSAVGKTEFALGD